MKARVLVLVLAATSLTVGGRVILGQHQSHIGMHHAAPAAYAAGSAPIVSAFALPTAATTRALLEGAVHTSEFVDGTVGRDQVRAYVSYPDRADKAPVVVVNTDEGMSDWARALGFQASREGFIAVVAEETLPKAVRQFASRIPAANGTIGSLEVRNGRITARVGVAPAASFALNDQGWSDALRFLSEQTGNRFVPLPHMGHVAMEMRAHPSTVAGGALSEVEGQQAARGGQAGRGAQPGQPRQAPGLNVKPDDLPANWVMADKIANTTPRRNEWIDIPVPGTNIKVHTWVVYPDGEQKAGAVLVLHGASGITDWIRGVADQLAQEGFIGLAVDLSSGLGPNGGNFDSFRFMDERMRATQKLGRADVMARITAVRDYAAKMPRSNGKTGSIGFCGGGTNSFTLATDVPAHNASVVYYGTAPPTASLAKATAPVLGFYGEDDARVFADVEPTRAEMQRLGKAYEAHTYRHATHSFLWMQDLGDNFEATADSWPRTIAFFRRHLGTPGSSVRR
jgi:carboxymethylenebutenolidase